MTRIWQVDAPFSTYRRLASGISVSEYVKDGDAFAQSLYVRTKLERLPIAAEVILTVEDFDLDYFQWAGAKFVSERMRAAMALDRSEVQFLETETSQSAALPISKNYKLMDLDAVEDVADLDRTEYEMVRYMPGMMSVPSRKSVLYFRPDAAPTHDLFYEDFFTKELLCTDAFALRVLKAGCTGLEFSFWDDRGQGRALYRTLRGVEQIVGKDAETGADITELVEIIASGD